MAITRTSYPERVMIVLNADGSLKGAHQESLERLEEDGVLLQERQLSAVPVVAATLASVLPDTATLQAQIMALTAERDAAVAERDALQAQIASLQPPADTIDGVPQSVSAYQARAALLAAGLLPQAEAAVVAAPDEIVRIAWEYATVVRRQSPFISALAPALGLDDAAIDALFVAAAAID